MSDVLAGRRGPHRRGQHLSTMSAELVRLPTLATSKRPVDRGHQGGLSSQDPLGPLWAKPLSAKPDSRFRVPPIRHLSRAWRVAPRPGDVFRPGPRDWNKPRPLGLLPERERDFDPFFFYDPPPLFDDGLSRMLAPLLKQKLRSDSDDRTSVLGGGNRSTRHVPSRVLAEGEHSPPSFDGTGSVPYRSSSEWRPAPFQEAAPPPEELREREYMEALVRMAEMDTVSRRQEGEVATQVGGTRGVGRDKLRQPKGQGEEWEDPPHIRPPLNVSVHALSVLVSLTAWYVVSCWLVLSSSMPTLTCRLQMRPQCSKSLKGWWMTASLWSIDTRLASQMHSTNKHSLYILN